MDPRLHPQQTELSYHYEPLSNTLPATCLNKVDCWAKTGGTCKRRGEQPIRIRKLACGVSFGMACRPQIQPSSATQGAPETHGRLFNHFNLQSAAHAGPTEQAFCGRLRL